jgi:hypothetical protein
MSQFPHGTSILHLLAPAEGQGQLMTAAEWPTCLEPDRMLAFLDKRASERKLRLFGVACSRSWPGADKETVLSVIALVTRLADTQATDADLREPRKKFRRAERGTAAFLAQMLLAPNAVLGAVYAAGTVVEAVAWKAAHAQTGAASSEDAAARGSGSAWMESYGAAWIAERVRQAALVREVFGNPFARPLLDRSWLMWNQGCCVQLARTIYDEQRFAELPFLADALEEAGCTDPDMLSHCRQASEHVRGCFVLDLILERK